MNHITLFTLYGKNTPQKLITFFGLANMSFYHLTFSITGLPNFWQKAFGPLKDL